jgi:hypothetical protein
LGVSYRFLHLFKSCVDVGSVGIDVVEVRFVHRGESNDSSDAKALEINQSIHVKDIERHRNYPRINVITLHRLQHQKTQKRNAEDDDYHDSLRTMIMSPVVRRAVNQPSPDPKTVNMKKLLPTRKCKHLLSKFSIIQTKQIKGKQKVNFPRQKFSSPLLSSSIGTP